MPKTRLFVLTIFKLDLDYNEIYARGQIKYLAWGLEHCPKTDWDRTSPMLGDVREPKVRHREKSQKNRRNFWQLAHGGHARFSATKRGILQQGKRTT